MNKHMVYKQFTQDTCIKISRSELGCHLTPSNFDVHVYALKPDGTPDSTVSLDADREPGDVDGEGNLTVHLRTPRTGVVVVSPLAALPRVER